MKTYQGFTSTSWPPARVDVDYFNIQIPLKDVAATSPNPFLTDNSVHFVYFFVQILVFVVLINTTGTSEAETT